MVLVSGNQYGAYLIVILLVVYAIIFSWQILFFNGINILYSIGSGDLDIPILVLLKEILCNAEEVSSDSNAIVETEEENLLSKALLLPASLEYKKMIQKEVFILISMLLSFIIVVFWILPVI